MKTAIKKYWTNISLLIILSTVVILVPIFVFWTVQNINKQKEQTIRLMLEKGDALIRSLEAGARAGFRGSLGMPGVEFRIQRLFSETALLQDILYIVVTDDTGTILVHSDDDMIGKTYDTNLDLKKIILPKNIEGHPIKDTSSNDIFEVYRPFFPESRRFYSFVTRYAASIAESGADTDQGISGPGQIFPMLPTKGDIQDRQRSGSDRKGHKSKDRGRSGKGGKDGDGGKGDGKGGDEKGRNQKTQGPGSDISTQNIMDNVNRRDGPNNMLIFIGLDMGPVEVARRADTRNTVIMAVILLLIGFTGVVSLSLAQAYRSTKNSLTLIKAFSDSVVENMPIGLIATDAEGRIASSNDAAGSLLSLSSEKTLGNKVDTILPEQLLAFIDQQNQEKVIVEKDIDCTLDNGRQVPLEVIVSSLEGDTGLFLGNIILFRDLTEVQALKKEIEINHRLASLGRLAAGIAHEIRNPLSSIKGFATYFKERYKENPEDLSTAKIMIQEVERLNRVIGQLLEFARPMSIQKTSMSMNTIIQHSLKMIERQAEEKNIRTTIDIQSDIRDVLLDPDRIYQVFLNLYLNAIEAMNDGGTLSVSVSRDDSSRIIIKVSDTGLGIDKADLEHIFDPYFTTKQSGTGLGLAIVHRIVESHNGEIRVQSERGHGATIIIILPDYVEKKI
ncbi:MAG: PAS domain S-box protein [Deltaproteobacteria bacterium]|nr:PAS domain S-box protein [Deltaproteobacteria bacterium]